ncbi:hypothetical protein DID88_002137 [Monilinia fructigena]|uniref:Uncharacterized protein n=1 Tax=Monilinia fructigena TaxID=38457 RepID=A0A395IVB2_9HELO|nr:hypothetical protein DID88_002137 [Monilinia fructigena]
MPEVAWKDDKMQRIGPPGRFVLKLYAVSKTASLTDEEGGVHTLATQDDINYYNGEYDDIPPGYYDYKDMPEAEKNMNRRRVEIENRARAKLSGTHGYTVMSYKTVQGIWQRKLAPSTTPYFPEPPVEDAKLPPPWNDLTKEQGGGLGRPVPEYLESHELGIDDLFHATTEYEKAAMVRLLFERHAVDSRAHEGSIFQGYAPGIAGGVPKAAGIPRRTWRIRPHGNRERAARSRIRRPGSGLEVVPPFPQGRRSKTGKRKSTVRTRSKAKREKEDEEEGFETGPYSPSGCKKSVDKALITCALEIPELQNSVLFCTVAERRFVKGIIYLVGLAPSTTVLQIKQMLTEKETGVPVEDIEVEWVMIG